MKEDERKSAFQAAGNNLSAQNYILLRKFVIYHPTSVSDYGKVRPVCAQRAASILRKYLLLMPLKAEMFQIGFECSGCTFIFLHM